MKIRVILERVYELNCDLENLGFDDISEIVGMEELEEIEENYKTSTTWLKSAELMEDDE